MLVSLAFGSKNEFPVPVYVCAWLGIFFCLEQPAQLNANFAFFLGVTCVLSLLCLVQSPKTSGQRIFGVCIGAVILALTAQPFFDWCSTRISNDAGHGAVQGAVALSAADQSGALDSPLGASEAATPEEGAHFHEEDLFRNPEQLAEAKEQNSRTRVIRWRNTFELIKENPLGIGPQSYTYGYLAYRNRFAPDPEANESWVPRSPHNAFLGALAESGWLYGLGCVVFLFAVCLKLLVPVFAEAWKERCFPADSALFLCLAGYLCVDALVAFPTDNAFPFFVFGLMLTAGISLRLRIGGPSRMLFIPRAFVLAIGVLLLAFALVKHFADKTYAAPKPTPSETRLACELMPEHLELCLRAAESWLNDGHPEEALALVDQNLRRSPLHFPSMARTAEILMVLQRPAAACEQMKKYIALFPESTRYSKSIGTQCAP